MQADPPLGHYIDLTAGDGSIVRSYVARPNTPARGALVVLQHMDQRLPNWQGGASRPPALGDSRPGVNPHVRQMAEAFALAGYVAIAPSTFSRGHSGTDYGYRFESNRWGQRLIRPLEPLASETVMLDIEAALVHGQRLAPYAPVGVVGYCWGGLLAWRAAARFSAISAAVCHYGGGMESPEDRQLRPFCPVLVHFPTDSRWMSTAGIQAFQACQSDPGRSDRPLPTIQIHPGRYGFMQPQHEGHDAALSRAVHAQTLDFLASQLAPPVPAA